MKNLIKCSWVKGKKKITFHQRKNDQSETVVKGNTALDIISYGDEVELSEKDCINILEGKGWKWSYNI